MSERARARAPRGRLGQMALALRVALGLAVCAGLVAEGEARAQTQPRPITEPESARRAFQQSPTLQLALLDLEAAKWAVVDADGSLPWTFLADTTYTRGQNPTLTPASFQGAPTTQVGTSNRVDWGAGLTKRFVIGTDFSARIFGSWEERQSPLVPGQPQTVQGPGYGLGARLELRQPLLRGAGTEVNLAPLKQAEKARTVAERARDRAANDLLRDVLVAHWELWYATRSRAVQEEALGLAQRQLDEARERAKTGSAPAVDALAFETRVATIEEQITSASQDEGRRSVELARLLGEPATRFTAHDAAPPPTQESSEAMVRDALARSPEVAEAKAAIELAELRAKVALEPVRPKLDLGGYVEARGLGNQAVPPALEQFGGLGAVGAQVYLTYEMPLDDRRRRALAATARLAVEQAKARLTEIEQRVEAQTLTLVREEAAARARVALAERTVEVARTQLEAERARYQTGSGTPTQVLQAEADLRAARLRLARAQVDRINASTELSRQVGALLGRFAAEVPKWTSRISGRGFYAALGQPLW